MIELQNRTIICTILFLDIVEYSRKPVAEQMKLRDRFNVLLREALDGSAANDRVILDTGDGAAVTFLGDPESAMLMALRLREAIAAELLPREHQLSLRCGINLGPVKLVKDLNARPNIIGDGINVAQRIMGFSQPGQVLVSRSYFEVISRLSEEYANLFRYEGSHTDKHVREHEVYGLNSEHRLPVRAATVRETGWKSRVRAWLPGVTRFADHLAQSPLQSTLLAMVAILAVGAAMRSTRQIEAAQVADRTPAEARRASIDLSAYPPPAAGSPSAPAITPASAPDVSLAPPAPVAIAVATDLPGESNTDRATHASPPETAPKKAIPARKTALRTQVVAALPVAEDFLKNAQAPKEAAAPQEALVRISIAALPWGEIYLDGTRQGVSPPVQSIQVPPGRHEIEIRNTTFPSHRSTIEVGASDRITIRHRFPTGESP